MRQEVVFALKVASYNAKKYMNRFMLAGLTKSEHEQTREALLSLSRPTVDYAPFSVELIRISPGFLDDDNLRPSFKAVRDEVASWCGVDDGDRARISWVYKQRGCPMGQGATEIAITCQRHGDDVRRILSGVPSRIGSAIGDHDAIVRDVPKEPAQLALPVHAGVYAELPWEQRGPRPVRSRLSQFALTEPPPSEIMIAVPVRALACGVYQPGSAMPFRRTERRTAKGDRVFVFVPNTRSSKR